MAIEPNLSTIYLLCPEDGCEEQMPLVLTVSFVFTAPHTQEIVIDPDLTDVWAHHFTHHPEGA